MIAPQLLSDITRRYGVGTRYATAYLEYWMRPERGRYTGRRFDSLDDILALPPPDSVWFDYALSTNQRGRAIADLIRQLPQAPLRWRRCLDVGCGFGGLLAAFAATGAEVRGLELDPVRVGLSRANCADRGLPAEVVLPRDILAGGLREELGRFDVITMIDVIEHVLDMPRALTNVVDLLEPGGLLVLEIPNRHSMRFVGADGHFALFGITLLDRADAMAMHRAMFGGPYDVGDYFALDEYRQRLNASGCEVALVASPVHAPGDARALTEHLALLRRQFETYRRDVAPRLTPVLDAKIHVAVSRYISRLFADVRRLQTADDARDFATEYLIDFWTLAAKKTDAAASPSS